MKKLFIFLYIPLLTCGMFISTRVNAQNIHVIDIEKSKDSYSRNDMYTTLDMFAELNGVFYFSSNDGIHGRELWRSDGTEDGTWLVKDINPDTASSNVNDIVVSGNKIFFSANDGVNGQQLWVSDGTTEGTQMLPVFNFGASTFPSYITDVNGTAFFVGNSFGGYRDQIWKTDGTQEGTVLVADFSTCCDLHGYNIRYLTYVNGKVFFTVNTYSSFTQLFVTDGTPSGTHEIDEPNSSFEIRNPNHLTALNGLLYFSAEDFTGTLLWVSDGTTEGTHRINNINNITLPPYNYYNDNALPFTIKGNTLFFQGIITSDNYELCKYDASDTGNNIKLVKDIVPGLAGSYPNYITNVNGTIFFIINPASTDAELWKTDGTTIGTKRVKNINPGGINYYYGLVPMDSILMFAYANDTLGFELWKSDGTAAGTVLVKDIYPGVSSSYPQYITYHGDMFVFSASDGERGFELWKSDGTKQGTRMIKNINNAYSSSSNPSDFTPLNNNTALFTAGNSKYGYELWKTNGFSEDTKVVKDLIPGTSGSYPRLLTNYKNSVYFFASTDSGYYLCKTDGTYAGTSLIYKLNVNGYVNEMAATDNLLFFTVFNFSTNVQELWRSNGTMAGTYLISASLGGFYPLNPVGAGKNLFFVFDGELWTSNGTTIGTKMVKDINTGIFSSNPFNLTSFNGKLYFAADNGYGPFLWTSDGTNAGTKIVKAATIQHTPFAQANGKLFFSAFSTVAKGTELYATDGTSAGTKLVKDIGKGPASSYPYSLANGDTLLYFLVNYANFNNSSELWVSNGTKAGTHKVKTIALDFNNTDFTEKVNVNDKLFFTFRDTLWQSDATEEGTHQVSDSTLQDVNNIHALSSIGNRLYFTAFKYTIGQELYTATVEADTSAPAITITKVMVTPAANTFEVKLLNNPVGNQLRIMVNVKDQQVAQVMIIDASGRVLASAKQTLPPGVTVLSYETGGWTQGIYMVKIVTADGHSSVLKAVK